MPGTKEIFVFCPTVDEGVAPYWTVLRGLWWFWPCKYTRSAGSHTG